MTYMNDRMAKVAEEMPVAGSEDVWHFQEQHYFALMDAFTSQLRKTILAGPRKQSDGLLLPEARWPELKRAAARLEEELQKRG